MTKPRSNVNISSILRQSLKILFTCLAKMSGLDDNMEVEINRQSAISNEDLERFSADFEASPKNRLALNAVTRNGIQEAALNRQLINGINHTFSDWIETSRVTNQKASGRCWSVSYTHLTLPTIYSV